MNEMNEINNIIEKYSYSIFEIDYQKILEESIKTFDIIINKINENDKQEYKNNFFDILINLSSKLSKKDFKKYLKFLKEYKIYKYRDNVVTKYFLKLYIVIYMIKTRNVDFFKKQYKSMMPKSIRKRILLFFREQHSSLYDRIKTLLPNKLYIDHLELVVTTKCTLRCKNCANLMQVYKKPYDVDKNIILKTIKKLEACVDGVCTFRILGGEPFCNPDLKFFLKELQKEKFKQVIIFTNGTIVPKDFELIETIKQKNVSIHISNYGEYSYKKDELIDLLEKENIKYELDKFERKWYDYGELEDKNREEKILEEQFFNCHKVCKSVLNGEVHFCPRSSHGTDLGIIKKNNGEYVDLLNNSNKENKKQLKRLMLRKHYIEACKYCNYGTKDCKFVPAAEQISN